MTNNTCKKTESRDKSRDVKRNSGILGSKRTEDPHLIVSRRDCPLALPICLLLRTHFCEQVEITARKKKTDRKKCEIK